MHKKIIHTLFEKQAVARPENIAVKEEERTITYKQLNENANALANHLRDDGVERETIAGAMMSTGIELITAMLAVFKSGGLYLPVDPKLSAKRQKEIINKSGAKYLITNEQYLESAFELAKDQDSVKKVKVLNPITGFALYDRMENEFVLEANQPDASTVNPEIINDGDDGNYMFFTSGSTGVAKAFVGMHKSLSHFIHWEQAEFGVDESFKISQLSPPSFDAFLRDVFLPLSFGGQVCIPNEQTRSNTHKLIDWIEDQKVTLIHCVPSLFRLISKELYNPEEQRFSELKHILMAGEGLFARDVHAWRKGAGKHVELVNLYGTSETTLAKTYNRIKEVPEDPAAIIPIGQPISKTIIAVINHGMACSPGEVGEIYIKTPFMTKGYFNDPELTRTVFVQNPLLKGQDDIVYKTGDLGRYLENGDIEVIGRLDDQVKINGIRVELNEVKQALLKVDGIDEAFVIAHKTNDVNELICYYVGTEMEIAEIRSQLQFYISESIMPSYYLHMDEFPLSINGKIDKKSLPLPHELVMKSVEYEPVQTETEQLLENIYCEVLGLKNVGRKASFFQIGGTSLKAIQVISRIYAALEISLKISDVFSNPTVRGLATVIELSEKDDFNHIAHMPDQEYYDSTYAQNRLWILNQFEKEKNAYNMPAAYVLRGNCNVAALKQSFEALVERHEILRTTFISTNGSVKQVVHDAGQFAFKVEMEDISGAKDKKDRAANIAEEVAVTAFDLENGPLLRVKLVRMEENEHLLLFAMHHIISDEWSLEILIKDVIAYYNVFSSAQERLPDPLAIQHRDYAAWFNQMVGGKQWKESQKYWLAKLEKELPVIDFPADYERPMVKSTQGDTTEFLITEPLSDKLQSYTVKQEVSLFMILMSALKVVLYKYTGQQDLIINAPISGRNHPQLEDQIGFFVNMLPLRTMIDTEDDFISVLQKVRKTTLEAFEHGMYPFDKIIEDLDVEHNPRRSPLTDIWMQLSDKPVDLAGDFDFTLHEFDTGYSISKVDLTFKFIKHDNHIQGVIEYSTDLFTADTIDLLKDNLLHVTEVLIDNPQEKIEKIKLLASEKEQQAVDDIMKMMQDLS